MAMTIIYIVLVVFLLGIIWHIFCHLLVVFHKDTTDLYVKKVMEDPYEYVKTEEMCYFFRNMVYLYFVGQLLFAACNGNLTYQDKTVEISSVKK